MKPLEEKDLAGRRGPYCASGFPRHLQVLPRPERSCHLIGAGASSLITIMRRTGIVRRTFKCRSVLKDGSDV